MRRLEGDGVDEKDDKKAWFGGGNQNADFTGSIFIYSFPLQLNFPPSLPDRGV